MKKQLLFIVMLLFVVQMNAQKSFVWVKTAPDEITRLEKIKSTPYSDKQQLYRIDINEIKKSLSKAKDKFSGEAGVEVIFPTINGEFEKYLVWENSNFEPSLQAKFPDIRAYIGKGVTNKTSSIHFSLSPEGIQTMVLKPNNESEFIEPYTKDKSVYVLFDSKTRVKGRLPFDCSTHDEFSIEDIHSITNQVLSDDKIYRTMRLALSCTGEYAQFHGGTVNSTLSAMNATMTRVNGIYEIDLSAHLNIIDENAQVIYLNSSTDPYSPPSIGAASSNQFTAVGWGNQLQKTLTSVLGNEAYDIGHLFGATGGGGNAGCIGCVCVDETVPSLTGQTKGKGFTSPADGIPAGDTFDINFVAHEMGHQLGAQHTFTFQFENPNVMVEPGSGSTIMAYAGVAEPYDLNIQADSDPYFTYKSIVQIHNNLKTKTCPEGTFITNTPPITNAGKDYTIPSGTAYVLRGTAVDKEGDVLTYCWEQDNQIISNEETGVKSEAYSTKLKGPNYRSFTPLSVPNRFLPEFDKVLVGQLSTEWESVSTVARDLNFQLTVRDNNLSAPQTSSDGMKVTSSAPYNISSGTGAGPFTVTSQNTNGITWNEGSSQIITWTVNNTASLAGSQNVNIKLSIDGGQNFNYTLASNTPNDGLETIIVPKTAQTSTNCRIWIEPTANIYYAINSKNFKVTPNLSNEDFNLSNFSLFPNPNKGSFNVKFDSQTSTLVVVTVHDLRGRNVFEQKFSNTGMFNQNINLNAIQSGVYIVTVKDGEQQVVKKIVVE